MKSGLLSQIHNGRRAASLTGIGHANEVEVAEQSNHGGEQGFCHLTRGFCFYYLYIKAFHSSRLQLVTYLGVTIMEKNGMAPLIIRGVEIILCMYFSLYLDSNLPLSTS